MDEKIDLEDMIIMIKEMSIESHEASPRYRRMHESYQGIWYWRAAKYLPEKLQLPFIRAVYFYSIPYKFDRGTGTIRIKGIIVYKNAVAHPDLLQNFDIYTSDENLKYLGHGMSWDSRSGSNISLFELEGEDASLFAKEYQLIVKNKQNGDMRNFYIQPRWDVHTNTFFDDRYTKCDFDPYRKVEKFTLPMRLGKREDARSYIMPGLENSFPWQRLEHEYWTTGVNNSVRYEGTHMGYEDVYSVKINFGEQFYKSTGPVLNAVADQKIYFAESEDRFYLVDADPVNVFPSPVIIY